MKALLHTLLGLMLTVCLGTSMAIPINSNSGASFYSDLVIANGGQLPLGLESRVGGPIASYPASSVLDAPDAVAFDDFDVVINGLSPATPSIFSRISTSTRNGGTEGAATTNNTQLYQILESELIPDGTSDASERGIWGNGQAQAQLTTEFYDTRASSDVSFERVFTFTNTNPFAFTFGIEGRFEMDLFATADGENSFAQAFARIDMFFSSANVLDIIFADTAAYVNDQDQSGGNTSLSIVRETDVANTGHLSLIGSATATGTAGPQQAFGSSSMGYALGITLQAGEEITMSHLVSYSNLAAIEDGTVQVAEPHSWMLVLFALSFLLIRVHGATNRRGHTGATLTLMVLWVVTIVKSIVLKYTRQIITTM